MDKLSMADVDIALQHSRVRTDCLKMAQREFEKNSCGPVNVEDMIAYANKLAAFSLNSQEESPESIDLALQVSDTLEELGEALESANGAFSDLMELLTGKTVETQDDKKQGYFETWSQTMPGGAAKQDEPYFQGRN